MGSSIKVPCRFLSGLVLGLTLSPVSGQRAKGTVARAPEGGSWTCTEAKATVELPRWRRW